MASLLVPEDLRFLHSSRLRFARSGANNFLARNPECAPYARHAHEGQNTGGMRRAAPSAPSSNLQAESGTSQLLSVQEAAARLGVRPTTLYDWLGQSDHGRFVLRGSPVVIAYYQGGARGQGRIRIRAAEIDRLLELMRVRPCTGAPRRLPQSKSFPGIEVPLGRPTA